MTAQQGGGAPQSRTVHAPVIRAVADLADPSCDRSPSPDCYIVSATGSATELLSPSSATHPDRLESSVERSSDARSSAATCPGYTLDIPSGRSPYGIYPFGLHVTNPLPWSVQVSTTEINLHSMRCIGEASAGRQSCQSCDALRSNASVIGIENRIRTGIHENTPFQYLPYDSTVQLLRRKNAQLEELRFKKLNLVRCYLVRARALESHTRFVMAVQNSDQRSRVHAVVTVARRNKMGIDGIVRQLDRANTYLYSSRSYEEQDFQRSYLLWKLGGQRAADLGARCLGLPSLSSTRRWASSSPLIASASFPTMAEMLANLQICFPLESLVQDSSITGLVIMVDEIKLELRFRWDPATNMIIGVCREHGGQCSLEFRTVEEVRVLGELLCKKKVHAASEVNTFLLCSSNHTLTISTRTGDCYSGGCYL